MNEAKETKHYSTIILFLGIILLIGLGISNIRNLQKIEQLQTEISTGSTEKTKLIESVAVLKAKLHPLVAQLTTINQKIQSSKHTSDSLLSVRNQTIAEGQQRINALQKANSKTILKYLNPSDAPTTYYDVINGDSVFITTLPEARKIAEQQANLELCTDVYYHNIKELSQKDSTIFEFEAAVFNLQAQKAISDSISLHKIALLTIEKTECATILRQNNRRQKIKTGIFSGALAILAGTIFYTWVK